MHESKTCSKLLLMTAFTAAYSTIALADVTNFARRIGEATLDRLEPPAMDATTHLPFRVWANASYANLQSDGLAFNSPSVRFDLGQFIIGIDHRWDNWLVGVGLSYTQVERSLDTPPGFSDSPLAIESRTAQEPGIAGYVAYNFSDEIFGSATVGFENQRTDFPEINDTAQTQIPFADLSINVIKQWGALVVKGRLGNRFQYNVCDDSSCDFVEDRYANTIYGFGEIGYRLDRWQPFLRTRIEESVISTGNDLQRYYLGAGVYYRFNNRANIGVVYERELKEELYESNQAMLNGSFAF